ncbi:MAG: SDR family NAD(P)-dependent oxidoreductase [Alphaproteobacteria bacterium]|jgi:3-oxoacyl-[acyl-carrier protein] reductase|nr:SDR family NAD(P)-dependent oxidoreductase [Alphaproteobacteria bacterium]MDP6814405.1 SDR family NAD(P)-dependent oxidoreductase [Alphaproteobacteria bacterium]
MSQRLQDKVALVTAAAGAGMGQAIARRFGEEGAKVVVTDAHERRVGETAEKLSTELGQEVLGLKLDVRQQGDIDAAVEQTLASHGRIDILYNNAGINKLSPVWELADDDWEMIVDICLTGTFRLLRAVLPSMIENGSGAIINVSSTAGWQVDAAGAGQAAYSAAKAGVMGLTRAVAAEVGQHGITVNSIAPGLIYNEFLERIYDKEWFEEKTHETLVGRMGVADDVAGMAVYLASDEGNFITGEVMCVSGGRYVRG